MVLSCVRRPQARFLAIRGVAIKPLPLILGCLAAAVLLAACGGHHVKRRTVTTPPPTTTTVPAYTGIHKIRHVVVIMQENRSFDSYFGTYPGADGIPMRHGRPTVCVPNPQTGGCVRPFHDRRDRTLGGPHGAINAAADINGGRMDGFIDEQQRGRASCANTFNPQCTLGQWNGERDGLPHRCGHPELLGLRARLRASGPHVRVQRVVESPGAPVHGL